MFYENVATSSNLEVGFFLEFPQSTPRGTSAQVPPTEPSKEPSLEVDSGDEMGGESAGDKTTAIQPSPETFMGQPVGLTLPARAQIEAPPDPGLFEPFQCAVVP